MWLDQYEVDAEVEIRGKREERFLRSKTTAITATDGQGRRNGDLGFSVRGGRHERFVVPVIVLAYVREICFTFEGTQPTLRQSPPMACCSTNAHVFPSPFAMMTLSKPAAPEPITTFHRVFPVRSSSSSRRHQARAKTRTKHRDKDS